MATFPELLNGYMARTGIGDTELSRRIGVSRLTLVRWKEGVTSRPRHRDDVLRCAVELRLTPEERNEFLASAGFAPEEASPTPQSSPSYEPEPPSAESFERSIEPTTESIIEPEIEPANPAVEPTEAMPKSGSRVKTLSIALATVVVVALLLGAGVIAAQLMGSPAPTAAPTAVATADPTAAPTAVATADPTADPTAVAAADGESIILLAPFANYTAGQQGYNIRGRIKEEIDREISTAGLTGVRTVEWPNEIEGEPAAIAAGRMANATIVIWGEYDSGRVIAALTIPQDYSEDPGYQRDQQVVSLESSPAELSITINVALAQEIRYMVLLTLGQLYLEREAFDDAKSVLIQAMAQAPPDPDALAGLRFRLGRAYQDGKLVDHDEAIWLFTQVLTTRPRSVETYTSRALAYLDRDRPGDLDLAIADLTRAIGIRPDDPAIYLNRGTALARRGMNDDLNRALADLNRSVGLDSEYAPAFANRAGIYLELGGPQDLELAFNDLEEALAIQPDLPIIHLNLGDALVKRGNDGDLPRAVEAYTQAVELDSNSPVAYFNRGLAYSALEAWEDSIADLKRAQELLPSKPEYNDALCWQLAVTEAAEAAMPYCDLAVEAYPNGQARGGRGLTHGISGRADAAIEDFEAFIDWVNASPAESCRSRYGQITQDWIQSLQAGDDPFDAETLRGLRVLPRLPRQDRC